MSFKIMFPPRPKNAIHPNGIGEFDNNTMIAQPKLNGSQGVLNVNEIEYDFRNRHKEILTNVKIDPSELQNLHRGTGDMILCGEYLNKNQKHKLGDFNHKYVLFDILMFNGVHLIGKTFKQRQTILRELFYTDSEEFDGFLRKVKGFENVYIVETFETNFVNIFNTLTENNSKGEPINPIYEGMVFKDKNAKLEYGFSEDNNHKTQVKSRRQTKNYAF